MAGCQHHHGVVRSAPDLTVGDPGRGARVSVARVRRDEGHDLPVKVLRRGPVQEAVNLIAERLGVSRIP